MSVVQLPTYYDQQEDAIFFLFYCTQYFLNLIDETWCVQRIFLGHVKNQLLAEFLCEPTSYEILVGAFLKYRKFLRAEITLNKGKSEITKKTRSDIV